MVKARLPVGGEEQAYVVADGVYLRMVRAGKAATVEVAAAVHHVLIVDASGSMSWELPAIRQQLKHRVATLVGEHDVVSIGWFSGPGECDMLVTGMALPGLRDVAQINRAIDRLQPVGSTCFLDPIKMIAKVVEESGTRFPKHAVAAFFMSDGQHNSGGTMTDVLKACAALSAKIAVTTIVAFGWYAHVPSLTRMAEVLGGSVVQAEGFERYSPIFEAALARRVGGGRKVEVAVDEPIGGVVFALHQGELVSPAVVDGKASFPPGVEEVFYLSAEKGTSKAIDLSKALGGPPSSTWASAMSAAYALVSAFAMRGKPKIVRPLLRALGDARLVRAYGNAFGQQAIHAVVDAALKAALGEGRFLDGVDPNAVPPDDAFCLLDMLGILREDPGNRLMLDDPAWSYTPIGRKQRPSCEVITPKEAAELKKLADAAEASGDVADYRAHAERLDAILATKGEAIKFTADPAPNGYPIVGLSTASKRPNISLSVTIHGTIDLTGRVPEHLQTHIPNVLRTKRIRSRTFVKDGLVHIKRIPVRLTPATWAKLAPHGVVPAAYSPETVVIDVSALPVLNAKMVGDLSIVQMAETQYALIKAQVRAKVLKEYRDQKSPKVSTGLLNTHGVEATDWLKAIGVTDNGFNEKRTGDDTTDVYTSKEITIALKGLASAKDIKVSEARARMDALDAAAKDPKAPKAKPLTPAQALFVDPIREVEAFLAAPPTGDHHDSDVIAWLHEKADAAEKAVDAYQAQLAEWTFCLAVGQAWPKEFGSVEQNSLTVSLGGADVLCTIELNEKPIHI